MLKILKTGTKKTLEQKSKETFYKKKCWNCGCTFLYQNEDICEYFFTIDDWDRYVTCPQCKRTNTICIKLKYKENKKC